MLSCVTFCLSFSLREVPFMSLHPHNGFPGGSVVKNLPANAEAQETWVRSLGWEDSPGDGNGNSLQYFFLGNPVDKGAWRAVVHGVTESDMTD